MRAGCCTTCAWRHAAPARAAGAVGRGAARRSAPPSSCATTCAGAAPSSAAISTAIRRRASASTSVCPYFYPGHVSAARCAMRRDRGVQVRLLMQGMRDYRFAGLAARALYDEMLAHGVRIFEYTPAFLHAKVAPGRRRMGDGGQLQHRSAVAAAEPRGQRGRARRRLQRRPRAEFDAAVRRLARGRPEADAAAASSGCCAAASSPGARTSTCASPARPAAIDRSPFLWQRAGAGREATLPADSARSGSRRPCRAGSRIRSASTPCRRRESG